MPELSSPGELVERVRTWTANVCLVELQGRSVEIKEAGRRNCQATKRSLPGVGFRRFAYVFGGPAATLAATLDRIRFGRIERFRAWSIDTKNCCGSA